MRTFNHVGIPTTVERENETFLEEAKLYVTDYKESPSQIEWLRFLDGSPMPELLQTATHVAFTVPDLDAALEGQDVLLEPFEPMEGVRVAFIIEDSAPIELMQLA